MPSAFLARPPARPVLVPRLARRGLGQSAGIQALAQGIITQENANPALNNPGNLMYAGQPGATLGPNGLAQFDTYNDGLQALYNQLGLYESGACAACGGQPQTIASMTQIYAPASVPGNDPGVYAANLAAALGVSTDTSLSDIDAGSFGSTPSLSDLLSNSTASISNLFAGVGTIDPTTLAVGAIFAGLALVVVMRR